MTTPAWPGTLPPQPLVDGWEQQLSDNRYQFKPKQGRPMMRTLQTQALDTQTVQFKLSVAQKAIFETFYRTTLGQGVLSFTFTDPPSGVTYDFQFVGDTPRYTTPDGGASYMCRVTLMRVS